MITVTERATTALQRILEAQEAPSGQGVKLMPDSSGGISMTIAPPEEGDEVVFHDESPLLIIDSIISDAVDGMVFDVQSAQGDDEQSVRFMLRPRSES